MQSWLTVDVIQYYCNGLHLRTFVHSCILSVQFYIRAFDNTLQFDIRANCADAYFIFHVKMTIKLLNKGCIYTGCFVETVKKNGHNPNLTLTQLKSWVWHENDFRPPSTTTQTQCHQYLSQVNSTKIFLILFSILFVNLSFRSGESGFSRTKS